MHRYKWLIGSLILVHLFIMVCPVSNAQENSTVDPLLATIDTQPHISQAEAIRMARTTLDIPLTYETTRIILSHKENSQSQSSSLWEITFKDKSKPSINVSIHSKTGSIIYFSRNDDSQKLTPVYPEKVNIQQATDIALQWIQKIKFPYFEELWSDPKTNRYVHDTFSPINSYRFFFPRQKHGIPYPAHGVRIEVDCEGQVNKFTWAWNEQTKFDDPTSVLHREEAMNHIKANMIHVWNYRIPEFENGPKIPYIEATYMPFTMDAKTGERLTLFHDPFPTVTYTPLTQKPLIVRVNQNPEPTIQQVIDNIKLTLKIPATYGLEYANSSGRTMDDKHSEWEFHWVENRKNEKQSDTTQPKTFKVKYLPIENRLSLFTLEDRSTAFQNSNSQGLSGQSSNPLISYEYAKQLAGDFIKQQLPHMTHQIVVASGYEMESRDLSHITADHWYIPFYRMTHGVIAYNDQILVGIDKMTGEVKHYEFNLASFTLPQIKPKLLSREEVQKKIVAQSRIELYYTDTAYQSLETKLIYQLQPIQLGSRIFLDAIDGKWRKTTTGIYAEVDTLPAKDLVNHPAQLEMQLMVDQDVFRKKEDLVYPDQFITWREMLKMLVMVRYHGGDFYADWVAQQIISPGEDDRAFEPYLSEAITLGLIKSIGEVTIDQTVSREQLAKWIVRLLGYHQLAKYNNVFNQEIKDAPGITSYGEAALVVGLGIMELQSGEFNPNQLVTRAQAVITALRLLYKRVEISAN